MPLELEPAELSAGLLGPAAGTDAAFIPSDAVLGTATPTIPPCTAPIGLATLLVIGIS